jgi:hypothetical protein
MISLSLVFQSRLPTWIAEEEDQDKSSSFRPISHLECVSRSTGKRDIRSHRAGRERTHDLLYGIMSRDMQSTWFDVMRMRSLEHESTVSQQSKPDRSSAEPSNL